MAQQKADIMVSYTASSPNFITGEAGRPNQYILLANSSESKFYSPNTEFIDSLRSTPEGDAKYKEMTRGAFYSGKLDESPKRDGSYYVLKNANHIDMYDLNGMEKYRMTEPMADWNWQIADNTKKILGYECQMATTDFHGRKWTVWFTPDIPIMNGPWKLGGLPGLILEATESEGLYGFVATGVQQTARTIVPVYSADDYEKIDRKDFLKSQRKMIDNPIAQMNAQLSGLGISIDTGTNALKYKAREEIDFIETDY